MKQLTIFLMLLCSALLLQNCEDSIREIQNQKKNTTSLWLNPLVAAMISGIVAFIFVKVGLK